MAFLSELEQWEDGIYQLETTDPVLGGPDGIDNLQAKQLANRTAYLRALCDALGADKQPLDTMLMAMAALATAANQTLYFTGPDAPALTSLTPFARSLLDDIDAATARATLGAVTQADINAAIANLVASSPAALDTLKELATALGNDPNFATTITNALALKAPLASPALTGAPTAPTAPGGTSTAQLATTAFVMAVLNSVAATIAMNGAQAAGASTLAARADHVHPTDTSRAPVASPAFTGTPTAPTPAGGTSTTQLATTAFVQAAIAALVNSSPAALDTLNELATALGNDPNFATTITNALALKAPLASPALIGTPTGPTAPGGTSTAQLATTAFVAAAIAALTYARLDVTNSWTKGQRGAVVALADAATIALDLSLSNNYSVTLGGNRTLGNPINAVAGQSGVIVVTQDGVGSRLLAYDSNYKAAGGIANLPALGAAAGSVSHLYYYVETPTRIVLSVARNVA